MYNKVYSILSKKSILLLIVLCLCGIKQSKASHATGADLTYQSLGNGVYRITFTFYRDCFGIDAPTQQTLDISSASCNFDSSATMNPVPNTGIEITQNCSTAVSTCNGGTSTGIQQWQYTVDVNLGRQCSDWHFSTSVSSRNAAVTTIVNPDFNDLYVDAYLNNTVSENNSPTFSNVPIAFECVGQNNFFNNGGIDADGDSLVYSFIAPRSDENTPLQYQPGYSVASPIISSPPVNINPITGDIFMHPTQSDVASVAVLITEYRNGVVIGAVMRDMQLYIVPCSNTLPVASGINGTNNFVTTSCIGGSLCFDVITNDVDPNQILTLNWNHGIPGATFTVTGSPFPVGHFCWTPTPADARPQPYTFTVTVRDNACPANGTSTSQYSITVSNMSLQLTSTPSVQCFGSHNGAASASATGNPPLSYIWTLPGGGILTSPSITHLTGGNYTLNVTDANGCVGTQNFNISEPPAINVSVTGSNAGCGGTFGSAIATVSGGMPGYSYLWTPSGGVTATATNLTTNTYTVRVTDSHSCTATKSVNIQSNTPVDFTIASTPATCLANDGSVTVSHTGGTGNFSYVWTPDVPGNNSTSALTGLITGSYSVIATDLGTGCSESLTSIVANSAGITATITGHTDATCQNDDNGTATVAASGGQPPYSYLWPNGDTTATTNHLSPGTYLAMVEDYNGCRAYASVTIGYQFAAPVVDLGLDTMPCIGTTFLLNAGAGFTSYLWSDNSTNPTLSVSTSGIYSVNVTNANGCQNFDAINVTFVQCPPHFISHSSSATKSLVNIYPNPANNELNVYISHVKNSEILLYLTDILGNNVYTSRETSDYSYSKKIDIHALPAGIYLIRVEFNGEINTTRIIKQ